MSASHKNIEEEQTRYCKSAVGHGLPSADTDAIQSFFADASPLKPYDLHANTHFIYVMQDKDGWRDNVKRVANTGVEVSHRSPV